MKTTNAALLIAVSAALLAVPSVHATVIVGSTNGANCYPFGCNDSGISVGQSIHFQQIYSNTAFAGPISIESLSFYNSFPEYTGNRLAGDYTFHLSTAAVTLYSMSPTLADNIGADNALFFSGNLAAGPLAFTVTGTPFYYDPTLGDLLLDIVVTNQDNVPNGSGNGYNDADAVGTVTQRSFALGNSTLTTTGAAALVTGFNADSPTVPVPGTLALVGLSLAGLARSRRKQL